MKSQWISKVITSQPERNLNVNLMVALEKTTSGNIYTAVVPIHVENVEMFHLIGENFDFCQ